MSFGRMSWEKPEVDAWREPREWWEYVINDDFASLDDIAKACGAFYAMNLEALDE